MIDDLLMEEIPLVTGAMAKYPYEKWIEDKFSCMSNFEEPYQLSRVSECGKYIYVPREVCPVGKKDTRVRGHDCGIESKITPRDKEQARVIQESYDLLNQGISHIVRCPTGFGKSLVGLDVAAKINKPTLIIVPKDDLMEQWLNNIHKFLRIPQSRVGVIQQNVCDYNAKWVVVGMLHSLSKEGRYPADMYRYFGLVVVDECERVPTDSFGSVMEIFPAALRLGMSATPTRKDGKDLYLQAHIGPILVQSDSAPMEFKVIRYESSWECPRRKVVDNGVVKMKRVPHTAGKCGHVISSIIKHRPTNEKICWVAKAAYEKDRRIVIFSDRVEHLEELFEICRQMGVPQKDMGYYVGARNVDGKKKTISRAEKEKVKHRKIIFATYGMLKYGTDIPWLDTLILASPRSDVEQIIGRIIRVWPGKKKPIAFDFNYSDSPVFAGYGKKRMSFYKSKGAEVKLK